MTSLGSDWPVRGVFINLQRSTERRLLCQQQLKTFDLETHYQRLEAVDGLAVKDSHPETAFSPAKLGCWLSHLNAMRAGLNHDHHHHILEDDFKFTPAFSAFVSQLDSHLAGHGDWDILFTDIDLAGMHQVQVMRDLITKVNRLTTQGIISVNDATPLYAAGNGSYIINRTSKQKVLALMEPGLHSKAPNDIYMRHLIRQGQLKALVTLPFITTVDASFSDSTIIGNMSDTNPSILMATLFRCSLAADANTRNLLDRVKKTINQLNPISDRGMIYAHLTAHLVSDDYKPY